MTFLQTTAKHYAPQDTTRTLFVFPSRRAATIFKNLLIAQHCTSPAPCCTPDEMASLITGLQTASRTKALLTLYGAWTSMVDKNTTLDTFLAFGDTLLSDIDALSRYGIDTHIALDKIADTNAASFPEESKSLREIISNPLSSRFTSLWRVLPKISESLASSLAEEKLATPGQNIALAAKTASETPAAILAGYDRAAFVNIGVPDPSLHDIMASLHASRRAEFLWDFSGQAVTDATCPASRTISRLIEEFPPVIAAPATKDLHSQSWKKISTTSSTASGIATAREVSNLITKGEDSLGIAVILADEKLLLPTLAALPDNAGRINVTMGLPIKGTAAMTLMNSFMTLSQKAYQKKKSSLYHHSEVTAILKNPLVRAAWPQEAADLRIRVRQQKKILVPQKDLEAAGETGKALFQKTTALSFNTWMTSLLKRLQATAPATEKEALAVLHEAATALETALPQDTPPQTRLRLLIKTCANATMPFEGEPVLGVQVLGQMETRCLDFRHVVIAGAEEGALPRKGDAASQLPHPLRHILGLPDGDAIESISQYNFWRSVCRAETITFICNGSQGGMRTGEESRYLKQLRHLYGVAPREESLSWKASAPRAETPPFAKDEATIKALEAKFTAPDATGAFSATSINTYLDCGRRFWFAHVLGIKEPRDIIEDIDAATAGTIYHAVMEGLYKPLAGKPLTKADILALSDEDGLRYRARDAARQEGADLSDSRVSILVEAVVKMAQQTLTHDAALPTLTIEGTEQPLQMRLRLPSGKTVRLYGLADRVDNIAGVRRVVDYKTGAVRGLDSTASPEAVFDRDLGDRRPEIGLQLYLYALMARQKGDYQACVYSTREMFSAAPKSQRLPEGGLELFQASLVATLDEIFNPDIPFQPSNDENRCKNCPYKAACEKQ